MARTTHFRYVLLILCLCAARLPAQEADLLPPLPPPYAVPPPEPDTLPPPPQLEWSPLGPKDEGGGGSLVETAMVPPPEAEAPIAPPPPPVIETPLPGLPDLELAKPDVEVGVPNQNRRKRRPAFPNGSIQPTWRDPRPSGCGCNTIRWPPARGFW